MRETIRVSELSLWLKCRRRAFLQYELGYDKDAAIMGVGRVVHAMLNEYYTGAPIAGDDLVTIQELATEDLEMCSNMMSTYIEEVEEEGLDVGQTTVTVGLQFTNAAIGPLDGNRYRNGAGGENDRHDT
ncbi:MAG: hypothetical protein GKR86_08835 [Ilumatobacter sp.]|nr:hypothetical protein [Ilumatobacter sp.]